MILFLFLFVLMIGIFIGIFIGMVFDYPTFGESSSQYHFTYTIYEQLNRDQRWPMHEIATGLSREQARRMLRKKPDIRMAYFDI